MLEEAVATIVNHGIVNGREGATSYSSCFTRYRILPFCVMLVRNTALIDSDLTWSWGWEEGRLDITRFGARVITE